MAVLRKKGKSQWKYLNVQFVIEWIKILLFDPSKTWVVGLVLLFAEIVVNVMVIWKIKCEYNNYSCDQRISLCPDKLSFR